MKRKTKSLDCLYFECASTPLTRLYDTECSNLRRTKSLDNIHLHVSSAWYASSRKLTRSQSLECLVNSKTSDHGHDVALYRPEEEDHSGASAECGSTNANSSRLLIQRLRRRTLIDDHNLPSCISGSFFNDLMKYEKNRLRTFKNWPSPFVTPADLSKAGFYYMLSSDKVRCFECKVPLYKWELGDQPILEHYKNNPRCHLINGYEVGNVPIDLTPLEVLQEYIDLNEFQPVPPNEKVIYNFDDLSSDQELEELDENALIFERERIVPRPDNRQTAANGSQSFSEDHLFELMKSEEMRLKTFDTWPPQLADKVKPADLARCGYFFTTIKDKVICAFCKVPTWGWEPTDVPIKEHYKHNQECPLLNDQACGNQPIKPLLFKELLLEYQDIAPSYPSSYSDDDVSFLRFTDFSRQSSSDSGSSQVIAPISNDTLNELNKLKDFSKLILTHKSVDKFYTFDDRLKTFDKWPLSHVNKNRLADAGFYFLEYNDQVKCFSCDLVLSSWSNGDDPWIEHCKHSSNCEYLILKKGAEFIARNAKLKNSPKIEVVCSGSTASSASSNSSSDIENEGSCNFEEELFKNVCKICMIKEADVVYLPCSHVASCASCTIAMKDCPLCKQKILSTMKIYIG